MNYKLSLEKAFNKEIIGLNNLSEAALNGCKGSLDKYLFNKYCVKGDCRNCTYENKRESLIN